MCGHRCGNQQAIGCQLSAVAFTCECVAKQHPGIPMDIYTDAHYVRNIIETIKRSSFIPISHKVSNYDLVQSLVENWNFENHKIHNVKPTEPFMIQKMMRTCGKSLPVRVQTWRHHRLRKRSIQQSYKQQSKLQCRTF